MHSLSSVIVILFCLCLPLKADKNILPGSRSIYVRNHSSNAPPDSLHLSLRSCTCPRAATLNPDPNSFCKCWNNYESQPDIQGDIRNVFASSQYFGKFFPGFGFSVDEESQEQYIIIPSPKSLIENLKLFKMDQFIELVPGNAVVDADAYLNFLAQGKIPVGDIPSDTQVTELKYLYHIYIHDLINHVFLWTSLSDRIRHEISARAQKIVALFSRLTKENEFDSNVLDYLQLIKSLSVLNFDTRMGTLNNFIFDIDQPFSLALDRTKKEADLLERIVNLGIGETIKEDNKVYLLPEIIWLNIQGSSLAEELYKAKLEGEENFVSFKSLKKDPQALKSLRNLLILSEGKIEKISQRVLQQAGPARDSDQPVRVDFLISIEEFYSEVKNIIRYKLLNYLPK